MREVSNAGISGPEYGMTSKCTLLHDVSHPVRVFTSVTHSHAICAIGTRKLVVLPAIKISV